MGEEAWNNLFTSKTKLDGNSNLNEDSNNNLHPDNFDEKRVTMASPGRVAQKEIRLVYGSGACHSFASLSQRANLLPCLLVDIRNFLTVD